MLLSAKLRAARDLLLRDGWGQGQYHNPLTHERCLAGAVWEVCSQLHTLQAMAAELPPVVLGGAVARVATWNDTDGRTPEEVLAVLEQAIARAEAQEAVTLAEVRA